MITPLSDAWNKFAGSLLPEDTPPTQRDLFQYIFYSGAQAALGLPDALGDRVMQKELMIFFIDFFAQNRDLIVAALETAAKASMPPYESREPGPPMIDGDVWI